MSSYPIHLLDGSVLENDSKYGIEHTLEGDGFSTRVILSPVNQRIQVLSYTGKNFQAMAELLKSTAAKNNFGKVWVKARSEDQDGLTEAGFREEGRIRGYFYGESDAVVMALYSADQRSQRPELVQEDETLVQAGENLSYYDPSAPLSLPEGYSTRILQPGDENLLVELYKEVFPTYPYPIYDADYLLETSKTHIIYRLIFDENDQLVAAASAETDPEKKNAEMTDFATLPSQRGKGLAQFLLTNLERDAEEKFGIKCYYTIARVKIGMIRTFLKNHYVISGTLVNNCSIGGQFETMILLVKK